MITAIRIRNFKAIKATQWIQLNRFHVLVGPNGSGKSTFLDAIDFIKSCLVNSPRAALEERVPEFRDLTFKRRGGGVVIEIRLNIEVSENRQVELEYALELASDPSEGVKVVVETLSKLPVDSKNAMLVEKTEAGKDRYTREIGMRKDSFIFGGEKLALAHTPPDMNLYPTANAVRQFLSRGIRFMQLNSVAMRAPTPATRSTELELDGTNLARVVGSLIGGRGAKARKGKSKQVVRRWVDHLRFAINDLSTVEWATREPDNAEYLTLKFDNGLECPSWLLSDGTLRMLALTLPAFLETTPSLYMVEEPENGVHPHALEVIVGALEAIPNAQTFVATHSPLVVQQVGVNPLLCFRKDPDRGVVIVKGSSHPALSEWQGFPELSSIFSARILG